MHWCVKWMVDICISTVIFSNVHLFLLTAAQPLQCSALADHKLALQLNILVRVWLGRLSVNKCCLQICLLDLFVECRVATLVYFTLCLVIK